jgi:two-component system, NtrC family, sensor histidine kinase HydH
MTKETHHRTQELFDAHLDATRRRADRVFGWLMLGQWLFAIVIAVLFSPYGWAGKESAIHLHVWIAVVLGGILSSLPIAMVLLRPGWVMTRHVVAAAQMLWSALLIHLTGGRIETHFHVFGSLAFLAFYRDWRVLVTATVFVAGDHFIRGVVWPESVYGLSQPEWWRFLEHAFWVVFENAILVLACLRGVKEMREIAERQAEGEALLHELRRSQEQVVKSEKLAAVGQLAASVGHELRNPLAAVRNAHSYVQKKLGGEADPKVTQFMALMDRELAACGKIISDLLDFARERPPSRTPCPLRPLVDQAVAIVPSRPGVKVVNEVSDDIPVPTLDSDQFRQVLVNLVQNGVEAMPATGGTVRVRAEGGDGTPWRITVADDGQGMAKDVVDKIFQPLFTTKTKGTGLGLAIVASMVSRHEGEIRVQSEPGRGTNFVIELPPRAQAPATV